MESNPFYDELLTLGQHLHERELFALYKHLIKTKQEDYKINAISLLRSKKLECAIANGEILYELNSNFVCYSARKKADFEYHKNMREVRLSIISRFQIKKLTKFFAQSEVDVIWNFPLPGQNHQEEASYCILSYPYFDLRHFSNGGSRFIGLINKLKIDNSDLMNKLKAY
jgi:hypothetical protein